MLSYVAKNIHYYTRYFLNRSKREKFPRNFNQINNVWWQYPVKLGWDEERLHMFVSDDWGKLYFCRYPRLNRYTRGVGNFLDRLASDYMLTSLDFEQGDRKSVV